jgi:hypothetical protein
VWLVLLFMKVSLTNELDVVKEVKVGFSWTIFFFGPITFAFRGMPMHFFVTLILPIILIGLSYDSDETADSKSLYISGLLNWGIAIYLGFTGNKMTAIHYLKKEYKSHLGDWEPANKLWNL